MAQDYTTTELVSTVRLRLQMYQSSASFEDSDILTLLNYELSNTLVPKIMEAHQEYFVDDYDFQSVIGQDAYDLPPRNIGLKLRDFLAINSFTPNILTVPIRCVNPEDITGTYGNPGYFNEFVSYYHGNQIKLFPKPMQSYTLRMQYFRKPNYLVDPSECAQITGIDRVNNIVYAPVPSTWTTANTVDVVGSQPPSFNLNARDVSIVSISSPTIVVSSTDGMNIGDWICLAQEAPVLMLPEIFRDCLIWSTVVSILAATSDPQTTLAEQIFQGRMELAYVAIVPRTDGEILKVSSGGVGLADYQKIRRYWYYY